jgi:hypothetical protein
VLYVDVAEVVVETDGHDSYVDGEDHAAATPDLLADVEAGLLEHIISEHADEVVTLTSLIPVDLRRVADRVVPVRLDRYGLVLRAIPANGMARDVRLLFNAPLCCPRELPQQMRELLGRCPLTAESSGGA